MSALPIKTNESSWCDHCGEYLVGYGAFPGGDPRLFHPDEECSTPAERELHRRHCVAAATFGYQGQSSCRWLSPTVHIFASQYGLGTYEYDCDCRTGGPERLAGLDVESGQGRP